MVVAGPGTGKTQLIGMRVANILRQTDTAPNNILCLTFTESGAMAMRQRLLILMGQDAYRVAIHTFHSFGTEIITNYPQFFYQGAHFRPADELSSFEALEALFTELPHKNPLATTMNGEFTALRDTKQAIAHLKKAGLAPDELLKILDHNELFMAYGEPLLGEVFNVDRFTKKQLASCEQLVSELNKFNNAPAPVNIFKPISTLCIHELDSATKQAIAANSTQPVTAWRTRWLERDAARKYVFKDRARYKKLRALADIYHQYLVKMQEQALFDFEDMILRVVHALAYFPELRFNLQEQYLYILVDEFQDTNGAQLRLLQQLTNNEVASGRPNIMVVGDDDQAIYAFQGAEIGNILQFRELYREPKIITLTENYRSTATILAPARTVITQGEFRLENTLEGIDKTLRHHNTHPETTSELHEFMNPSVQFAWIIQRIKQLIVDGVAPNEIAILGRNHRHLLAVLPYLHQAGLATQYERRNNVLEAEHIVVLITLARTVHALAEQQFHTVDALLPKLLSFAFWGLKTNDLWQLSLTAYKKQKFWLELMLDRTDRLRAIAEFLIVASHTAQHASLDTMLDMLIGSNERQVTDTEQAEMSISGSEGPLEEFISPLRAYYFTAERLNQQPTDYLRLLSNLSTLRRRLREYRPEQTLFLKDFVDFIDLHEKAKIPIVDTAQQLEATTGVNLMTAHKAKGLEFDTVFIIDCQESIWGPTARHRSSSVRFPHNLAIEPAGQTADDCLRLFYVAMTRARRHLFMSCYKTDTASKETARVSFLHDTFEPLEHSANNQQLSALEPGWAQRHFDVGHTDKQVALRPRLEAYQLSSTHLNNFLDVTTGGPQAFLLQNLLRFPQAMDRNAVFGSVIHAVLQRAHVHAAHTGERRPTEDIFQDFELQLQRARLSDQDFTYLFEKGSEVLRGFLAKRYDSFAPHQKAEYSFAKQGVIVGGVRLTGNLDLMEINEATKTITVIDYKTGKAIKSWTGSTDYEKIKLHKYRQQLMVYKLLIEHSRDFGGKYTVNHGILEFVEPDAEGAIQLLEATFTREEMQQFSHLLQIVWDHIMTLNLPDTSHYPATFKGVLQFEEDLLGGAI